MKVKLAVAGAGVAVIIAALVIIERSDDPTVSSPDRRGMSTAEAPSAGDPKGAQPPPVKTEPYEPEPAVTGTTGDPAAAPLIATGTVIDDRRFPVAGARVRLIVDGKELKSASTDPGGQFRFPFRRDQRSLVESAVIHATRGNDEASLRAYLQDTPEVAGVVDFGLLSLGPASDLEVEVVANGSAVADADVHLSSSGHSGRFRDVTDSEGRFRWPSLPHDSYRVRARTGTSGFGEAEIEIPRLVEGPVRIELEATWSATLEVVNAATGAPVPGVVVGLRECVRATSSSQIDSLGNLEMSDLTDADGIVIAAGLIKDRDYAVEAPKGAWHLPWAMRSQLRGPYVLLPAASPGTRIELQPNPILRFRLVDGEVPPPSEGTRLKFVGPDSETSGLQAWIAGGELLLEGLIAGRGRPLAGAPDGSIAELMTGIGLTDMKASFRRPRSVGVVVRDAAGAPLCEWPLSLSMGSDGWREQVQATDAEGCARWTGLPGGSWQVRLSRRGRGSASNEPLGIVDVERGDSRLEINIQPEHEAVLRVRIAGERRLPPSYYVHIRHTLFSPPRDVPAEGEIHLTFRPPEPLAPCRIQFSADGYETVFVEAPTATGARQHVFDIELAGRPRLLVDVIPPEDGDFKLKAHERDARGTWYPGSEATRALVTPNGDSRHVRWQMLLQPIGPGGAARVFDALSGTTGPELGQTGKAAVVETTLDLSKTFWLEGRIESARKEDLAEARVVATFDGDPRAILSEFERATARPGVATTRDGSFKVRLPGDQPIEVRAWHPVLAPDPTLGEVVVTAERAPIVLRLGESARASVRCRIPRKIPVDLTRGTKALLYSGKVEGEPLSSHPLLADGDRVTFGGFAPGTCTVCILVPRFAPAVLENVRLGPGLTDLGEIDLTEGTVLTIQHIKDRDRRVGMEISVIGVTGAPYLERFRSLQPDQESALFTGLGPGRYHVAFMFFKGEPSYRRQTIDVDGRAQVTLLAER